MVRSTAAVQVTSVEHRYGSRVALAGLTLSVARGEIFALLGPNGGGKTTLFRLLSTLTPIQSGHVGVLGYDAAREAGQVRRRIGVVFQSPSLDRKLTVQENLRHHGRLYGLSREELADRGAEMLSRMGLSERSRDLVETLSGGLRRRVELAKTLLTRPELLLLDEPSTGLDPGARSAMWNYLRRLRDERGMTIVLTTHLLEEADKADRLAILDRGSIVAEGTPEELRTSVGGETLSIVADEPEEVARAIGERFGVSARVVGGEVRVEGTNARELLPRLIEAQAASVKSITLGKPTLEDVFIARTGRRFWGRDEGNDDA